MRRIAATVLALVLALTVAPYDSVMAQPQRAPSPPAVMASAGDSITRAFNVGWCCFLQDSPSRSWSTGTNTTVNGHYLRLLRIDGRIAGHNYNDARSGARMRDLAGQLATATLQRADYVTVLIGANDVCTSSKSTMTPTGTFESQFRSAMVQFTAARPQARIFLGSIPDVHHLWELFRSNSVAVWTWSTFRICQSVLSRSISDADRQVAVDRLDDFNNVLATVCSEFLQCRWDRNAVFNTKFSAADVSTVDYFHPSTAGQRRLAEVTWAESYWAN